MAREIERIDDIPVHSDIISTKLHNRRGNNSRNPKRKRKRRKQIDLYHVHPLQLSVQRQHYKRRERQKSTHQSCAQNNCSNPTQVDPSHLRSVHLPHPHPCLNQSSRYHQEDHQAHQDRRGGHRGGRCSSASRWAWQQQKQRQMASQKQQPSSSPPRPRMTQQR